MEKRTVKDILKAKQDVREQEKKIQEKRSVKQIIEDKKKQAEEQKKDERKKKIDELRERINKRKAEENEKENQNTDEEETAEDLIEETQDDKKSSQNKTQELREKLNTQQANSQKNTAQKTTQQQQQKDKDKNTQTEKKELSSALEENLRKGRNRINGKVKLDENRQNQVFENFCTKYKVPKKNQELLRDLALSSKTFDDEKQLTETLSSNLAKYPVLTGQKKPALPNVSRTPQVEIEEDYSGKSLAERGQAFKEQLTKLS